MPRRADSRSFCAWRMAGITTLVADRMTPRRPLVLGEMHAMLASTAVVAVVAPCDRNAPTDVIAVASEHWVRDQHRYATTGRSIQRKRRKADRRDIRKSRLRIAVVAVAMLGLAASAWHAMGADAAHSELREHALGAVSFLIGLSLVAILITEVRGSIALDREDADAASGMEPLYRAALEQLGGVDPALQPERSRGILLSLGESVIDEQLEWYAKHRDGAQVDIVG